MKKITLFMALLMVSVGFSQQAVIQDFEAAGGLGDAFGGAAAALVSDPETAGTRGQVAMLSASAAGEVWQGININISDNYELVSNKTMQMDVYSTTAIEFAPKAQGGLSGAPDSVSSVSHTGSGWETLTITYDQSLDGKAPANGVYSQLALHYLWDINGGSWATPDSRVFYIDNIKATLGSSQTEDMDCAGTSTEAQQGVFPEPYTYNFETLTNGAVRLTFAMASGTDGIVAYAWKEDPFTETAMTVSGTEATLDIAGYAAGVTISYAVKFAWAAGGFGVTKYFSYIVGGEDCTSTEDGIAPADFTATLGTVSAFSVELLLNATDEGSNVTYNVAYGTNGTAQITGASDTTTSFVISGLTPETAYSFLVTASDASGNENASPITVTATTILDPSTDCAGQTAEYAYTFETLANGTDVRVTIELLNAVDGLVAQYFNDGSGNQNPTLVSGQKYEHTFTGLTDGTEIAFTAGFAWAAGGGLQVSRTYTVGNDCATASVADNNTLNVNLYPSPAQNELTISAENTIQNASIYNVLGRKVQSYTVNAASKKLDISALSTGIYILKYTANNAVGSMKFVKE